MSSTTHEELITTVGLVFEAANNLRRGVTGDLERETGLPGSWFETLLRLRATQDRPRRMSDLAAEISFTPSSFTRLVDAMEEAGLVERTTDPTNRRATLLRLTPAGGQRLDEAMKVHEPIAIRRLADHLSADDIATLDRIARVIRDANRL